MTAEYIQIKLYVQMQKDSRECRIAEGLAGMYVSARLKVSSVPCYSNASGRVSRHGRGSAQPALTS